MLGRDIAVPACMKGLNAAREQSKKNVGDTAVMQEVNSPPVNNSSAGGGTCKKPSSALKQPLSIDEERALRASSEALRQAKGDAMARYAELAKEQTLQAANMVQKRQSASETASGNSTPTFSGPTVLSCKKDGEFCKVLVLLDLSTYR